MFQPDYNNQFKRDLKKILKRGKNKKIIIEIIDQLIAGKPLNQKNRDHILIGKYLGRRECHIEPDWLLIYKLHDTVITFERTGTHSDLFS